MVHNDCNSKEIIELFEKAIVNHINDANIIKMPSAYCGTPTTLYYNAGKGVSLHIRVSNQFWICWKLSPGQLIFNNLL